MKSGKRLPAAVTLVLGMLAAAGCAALASQLGPTAVVLLVPAFALTVWRVGGKLRLVADGYPDEVEADPLLPKPSLGTTEQDHVTADAGADDAEKPQIRRPVTSVNDGWMVMQELPGGAFWMGSDKALDSSASADEFPRRRITLRPFAMAATPVTRGLWRRVMAGAEAPWQRPVPASWAYGDDELPATHVSWRDSAAFCNALSLQAGRKPCYSEDGACDWATDGYRLPTEAEWEYACRAGSDARWFWGDDERDAGQYAWYGSNARSSLHAVRRRSPNRFGLYDMAGNCWEWCWDWYGAYDEGPARDPRGPKAGRSRVLRGGSFHVEPRRLRSAVRFRDAPEDRLDRIGCRCVRSGARGLSS